MASLLQGPSLEQRDIHGGGTDMMALHGTILGGTMSYEAGMQVMSTVTPLVQTLGIVAILALTMGALIANAARRDDEGRAGFDA